MAETIGSAVVHESVSQILSALVTNYEEKHDPNTNRNLERLEMAHIRLEAALETSEKWQINDSSALLRWRRKLKRAAQECGDTLHKCKHQILQKHQMEQEVRNSSLSNRIVHATKSFAFSMFNSSNNELDGSIVQRFEWFADGATEFLRFMELGGIPRRRRHPTFNSFVKHLFADKNASIAAMIGEKQNCFHTDITLKQLEDILLRNATEYFCQNSEATVYQMIWTFKHGYALLHVEKETMSKRRILGGSRKRKLLKQEDQQIRSFWGWTRMVSHSMNLWGVGLPSHLHSSFTNWVEKENGRSAVITEANPSKS